MQLLKRRHLPRMGAHIPKATQCRGRRSGSLLREAAHGAVFLGDVGAGGHRGGGSPRAPAHPQEQAAKLGGSRSRKPSVGPALLWHREPSPPPLSNRWPLPLSPPRSWPRST